MIPQGMLAVDIARALGGKRRGKGWRCRCPAHDDRTPSLDIDDGHGGSVVMICRSGCSQDDVLSAVAKVMGWPNGEYREARPSAQPKTIRTIVYDYRDPVSGEVRYRKDRFERSDGSKTFCFRQIDGTAGLGGQPHILSGAERLVDLPEGAMIWLVEGEKAADRMRELGAIAVSGDTGHGSKWTKEHAELLRGLAVILWPDSDKPGEKYITNAAAAIRKVDPCADLRVVRPFGPADGGGLDVCDWTGATDNLVELAKGAAPFPEPVDNQEPQPDGPSVNAETPREGLNGSQGAAEKPPRIITLPPYVWQDPATLPMRRWLYGKHYIRKFISSTIAAGGKGKSSLILVEQIAMATGIALLGVPVPERLRCAYWGEDTLDEINRRIGAILLHYKIPADKINGWLFAASFRDVPLQIGALEKGEITFPDADATTEMLIRQRIDVLACDPFIKTHGVSENDNGAIERVARKFNDIAEAADCSIELPHHARKASSFGRTEVTADDGRGASALKDAARCVRSINPMTEAEAPAVGVMEKDHKRYFRVDDDAKANMTVPADGATWFKLVSVPLYNDAARPGMTGDEVGVATSWQLPGVFTNLSINGLPMVQAAIERGGPWVRDVQSDDWAGVAIAQTLDLDMADKLAKERVKRMLAAWIGSGALKVATRKHPKKANRWQKIVIVGNRVEGESIDEA